MGIDSVQILLEALIGVADDFGYTVVYLLFLNGHGRITALIEDFSQFIQYSGIDIIRKTDEKTTKYTKCSFYWYKINGFLLTSFKDLLGYCLAGLSIVHLWQIFSTSTCLSQRGRVISS